MASVEAFNIALDIERNLKKLRPNNNLNQGEIRTNPYKYICDELELSCVKYSGIKNIFNNFSNKYISLNGKTVDDLLNDNLFKDMLRDLHKMVEEEKINENEKDN
jgi:DNA-directed RNA polymerase sigma subunit (sigma70/sigma32)